MPEQACVTGDPRAQGSVLAEQVLIVPFDRGNLTAVRSLVAAAVDQIGLDAPRLDALRVVATELATNAVLHGGGSGVLRLWMGGGALHCQVTDEGPGLADADLAGTRLVSLTSDEGRGLWLARQLSDALSVVADEHGTTTTASFHLP
jgi:anti-sigma regulatory factor (Ser/Thr protein kinase)